MFTISMVIFKLGSMKIEYCQFENYLSIKKKYMFAMPKTNIDVRDFFVSLLLYRRWSFIRSIFTLQTNRAENLSERDTIDLCVNK